jgi:hypothetical protein
MKNEIILYRPNELAEHIEVRFDEETVWLNRQQIAMLFGRDVKTIGKHINNVFLDGELAKEVVVANFAITTQPGATVAKFATIQNEGDRMVESQIEYYNLDVIISVGYRVKSKQGTQFRIWANKILKNYLLKGYAINNRMNRLEDNVEVLKNKVNEIDLQINTHLIPTQGVFFDGQVFDACELASRIIHSAKQSIVLDAIISVGYRVNSIKATAFRQWATKTLKEFITKGFLLDDERLKQGKTAFGKDYFRELSERVRSIRTSERRIYQQITDIFAECSIDCDSNSTITKDFYAMVQNKFHYAIAGQTAAEIIYTKADRNADNMGLTTWKNSPDGRILKSDTFVAKNYLPEKDIRRLERAVTGYFDYIEDLIENENTFTMQQMRLIEKDMTVKMRSIAIFWSLFIGTGALLGSTMMFIEPTGKIRDMYLQGICIGRERK